jgi:hypothetical protein
MKIVTRLMPVALLVLTTMASAQSALRPPTDAEAKALSRITKVIGTVLKGFRSDDWDESIGDSLDDANVNTNAGVPLDVDTSLEWHYGVRNGSARWNSKIAPLMAKMQSQTTPEAMAVVGQQMKELMHVHVVVHFNRSNSGVSPPPPANMSLRVAGPAFAYKVTNEQFEDGAAYVLLFGRWQADKWDSDNDRYHFVFAHPNVTPFVENIEVRLYGAEDRLTELLRTIDWNKVNEALTL